MVLSDTALILVDIQNDYFAGGRWPVDNMQQVAANAAHLLAHARSKKLAIFHIRHEIPSSEAPFFRPGTPGAEIHASVAPLQQEPIILKHQPNSFLNTSLKADLEKSNIQNLVICGAMSQMCIDATTRAAVDLGYAVTVIEDACGAKEQTFNGKEIPAKQVHAAFMSPLAMSYANVTSTKAYLDQSAS